MKHMIPIEIWKNAKEALKPTVVKPAAGLAGSGEYAPNALNAGVSVAAKPNQKAPVALS